MKLLIVSFHCIALFNDLRRLTLLLLIQFFFMPIWGGRRMEVDTESSTNDMGELQVSGERRF